MVQVAGVNDVTALYEILDCLGDEERERRTANKEDFMEVIPCSNLSATFTDKMYFWPISFANLKHNKNLVQNPGWNYYENDEDVIKTIGAETPKADAVDLAGRRIQHITRPGFYVIRRQKVLVK